MPNAEVTKNIKISGIKGNTLHFSIFHLTFDGKARSASIRIKGNGTGKKPINIKVVAAHFKETPHVPPLHFRFPLVVMVQKVNMSGQEIVSS